MGHLGSILNLRDGRNNITIYAGYAMVIKRSLSHTGAAATVATLCGEEERGGLKSKDAVIRFEHLRRDLFSTAKWHALKIEKFLRVFWPK